MDDSRTLRAENLLLRSECAQLRAANEALKEENARLVEENKDLKRRLGQAQRARKRQAAPFRRNRPVRGILPAPPARSYLPVWR